MCQRVRCDRCGKPTYIGCGAHVEQILGDIPPGKRCDCPRPPSKSFLDLILRR